MEEFMDLLRRYFNNPEKDLILHMESLAKRHNFSLPRFHTDKFDPYLFEGLLNLSLSNELRENQKIITFGYVKTKSEYKHNGDLYSNTMQSNYSAEFSFFSDQPNKYIYQITVLSKNSLYKPIFKVGNVARAHRLNNLPDIMEAVPLSDLMTHERINVLARAILECENY